MSSDPEVAIKGKGYVAGHGLAWRNLPRVSQLYVALVIVAGIWAFTEFVPLSFPQPLLFLTLFVAGCLTSMWKVNLPIPLASGSTLSVSYAADLMTLLLLGPEAAMVVAVAGAWLQCTVRVKRPYPAYRTVFSMAAEAITMGATGVAYIWFGGVLSPSEFPQLARPLVATIATYFVVNTGLIAGAIASTSERSWWKVWRDDFLWSGASFMVAGTAGAAAAVVIARREHWKAALMLAPVYLTYRTYQVFVGRLEDQKRHTAETQRLHKGTIEALMLARHAEHALAQEKERLASTVSELTRLEEMRKQLLQRERSARASAEEASRLKDQFLAMVSHELRTPLNAILGWADMLRSGRLETDGRERASESIYGNAKRQARLIDELLDVARIRSGKLRLERTAVELEHVVRGAIDVVQTAADAKGVNIKIEADSTLGSIFGDPSRLQQIAWNLLSNAVKFTPEGGTVLVRLRRSNNTAEMVVTDTGAGIPEEFLPWVFEPFLQADASTTRPYGGLGLGLSIVKHLVEAHGGSVRVESSGEGRGATFTVRLPIVAVSIDQTAGLGTELSVQGASKASLQGISVLVVDDDTETRDVVAASLESCQAVVRTAASASQAFEVLQREHIDVLLADIAMPGEDGYALIRRLRALKADAAGIPAAALTALARDEDRQLALDAGFQLHLSKPIDADSLVAAVASLGKLSASPASAN
jgi:signal transduction histidine kinase/CheY-like chemotaxis protein